MRIQTIYCVRKVHNLKTFLKFPTLFIFQDEKIMFVIPNDILVKLILTKIVSKNLVEFQLKFRKVRSKANKKPKHLNKYKILRFTKHKHPPSTVILISFTCN